MLLKYKPAMAEAIGPDMQSEFDIAMKPKIVAIVSAISEMGRPLKHEVYERQLPLQALFLLLQGTLKRNVQFSL
jgi:hypothetical protein